MHIMEGFLPPLWCAIWYIVSIPFIVYGAFKVKRLIDDSSSIKPLIAVAAAFIFLLSALKIPSVTGSCSHPTGTGIAVVLFGPAVTAFLSAIVLFFQSTLLAHGGITTLGANAASMGIIGPFLGWLIYLSLKNRTSLWFSTFSAAAVADLMTYVVTSSQLALAFPGEGMLASAGIFMGVFAVTQVPIALLEGLLAAQLISYISRYTPDLKIGRVIA